MSINNNELPEYHFVSTDIDNKINTESKKILAKKIYLTHVWGKINEREQDHIFLQKIIEEYCEKLSLYLNEYNKVNFPVSFWNILILPWLSRYLYEQLIKWKIVNKILSEKKSFSFFSLPDSVINKCAMDTVNYYKLIISDNEFNYLHYKRILKYLKNKENKIVFIEKSYEKKKINNIKKNFFFQKTKIFIFELFDSISLFFSQYNNIFVEPDAFGKKNLLKINFKLKQFPTYFIKLFNYHMENKEYEKCKFNMEKRLAVSFPENIKIKENIDFMKYLNLSIRKEIPVCFLEGFTNLKNSAEKINMKPKLILSAYNYTHSEKFKFWVASKVMTNNSKFIITQHGGGHQIKFHGNSNYETKIADKVITWSIAEGRNEIQLPAAKLINFKKERKYQYLSYVEEDSPLFANINFSINPLAKINNFENINKFNSILKKRILKNLIYLPRNYIQSSLKEVKNIINNDCVAKPNSFPKYLFKSKIVVCTSPQTTFNEGILTGPTILIFKFHEQPILERFQKIFDELVKSKIIFSNPEDACSHINNIWDNVDDWWQSKDVRNIVHDYLRLTSRTSINSINIWAKFLKSEIKKNI